MTVDSERELAILEFKKKLAERKEVCRRANIMAWHELNDIWHVGGSSP